MTALRNRLDPLAVGGLFLIAFFLAPGRFAAFRGDDAFTSELNGERALFGGGRAQQLWDAAELYVRTGRPNVLGTVQGFMSSWALGNHPMAAKLVILALILAAAAALWVLVRELGHPRPVALLVMTLFAGAVQFRSFHDGALGYWGMAPTVMLLLFWSLVLFLRAVRSGGVMRYVASIILFVGCLLLYEGAYPFFVLHIALALFERRGRVAWRAAMPFVVAGVAFIAFSYFGRAASDIVVPGYEVGGTVWGAARTFVTQLFSPIPGSSLFFRGELANFYPLGDRPSTPELFGAAWRGAAVFGVVVAVAFALLRPGGELPSNQATGRLALIGGLIWVLPVAIISLAPKYQFEIVPGKGHLPALMQVFGWGLVLTAIVVSLARLSARRSPLAARLTVLGAAGLLGFGAAVDGYINLRVVALEGPVVATRDLLEDAVDDGILDPVPEGSTVVFTERDLKWQTGYWAQVPAGIEAMLIDRTGRRYDGRMIGADTQLGCASEVTFPPPDCAGTRGEVVWVHVRPKRGGGTVVVAAAGRTPVRRLMTAPATWLRVYTRGEAYPVLGGLDRRGRPWTVEGLVWDRLDDKDGWQIYEASIKRGRRPVAATLYDDSQPSIDFTNLGTPADVVRYFGTRRLLP